MRVLNRGLTATALAALALTAACSSDDNNNGGGNPSTVWTGIIQADNATDFGALRVTAATDAPAPPALSAGDGSFGFVVVNGVNIGNYYLSGITTPVPVDGTVAGGTAITLAGATTGTGTITAGSPSTATGTFDVGADTFTWTATDCTP